MHIASLQGAKTKEKLCKYVDLTETDYLQKGGPSLAWSNVTESQNTREKKNCTLNE
jgi:hypothetical protein